MSDAFDYFVAPANSFGIKKASFIKWNYFWQLFNQHSDWDLEYNDGSGWISCKEDLTIIKVHPADDEGVEDISQEKITLDFTASHTADYRLTFAIDSRVKDYVVKLDEYKYELNYKVGEHEGEDEIYSVFFDWSDIVEIPGIIISHGMTEIEGQNYFWFRARKNDVNEGAHLIIDPTFGRTSLVGSSSLIFDDDMLGTNMALSPANNGTATSISLYCDQYTTNTGNMCFALYDSSDDSLVVQTEEIPITTTAGWHTASFVTPPTIYSDKTYYIMFWYAPDKAYVWSEAIASSSKVDEGVTYTGTYPDNLPTPWTNDDYDRQFCIYCTYDLIPYAYEKDLQIYYDSLTDADFIDCWCSRWDVQNYNVIIETWLKKADLQTLRDNITPGAIGELYVVLGRPRFFDSTWQGNNTIMLSPNSDYQLSNMRKETLGFVKTITTNPVGADSGWINCKIELAISGSGDL